jgi:hypothetical protein
MKDHSTVLRRSRKPISPIPIPKRKDPQRRRSKLGINLGENNGMWKGDNVSYAALHDYIKYHLPRPEQCEICKKVKPYDLANKSGEYRRDFKDWYWLCRKCHMRSDGRIFIRDKKGRFCRKEQEEITAAVPTLIR